MQIRPMFGLTRAVAFLFFGALAWVAGPAAANNTSPPEIYRSNSWGGEWPNGFTLAKDTVTNIRSTMDIDADRDLSCTLKKGATYHLWNQTRVADDNLKFVTLESTSNLKLKKDYEATFEVSGTQSTATLSFAKGDLWTFLTYYGEGLFEFQYDGKRYVGDQELSLASEEVVNEDGAPEFRHQWLNLTCANGTRGWLLYSDIAGKPGFNDAHKPEYGKATDFPQP